MLIGAQGKYESMIICYLNNNQIRYITKFCLEQTPLRYRTRHCDCNRRSPETLELFKSKVRCNVTLFKIEADFKQTQTLFYV